MLCAAQAPGYRLIYRLDIVRATSVERRTLATGEVGGSLDTGLRLSLRDPTVQIEALLGVFPEADSLTLTAEFFTKRRLGRSRRALPLWEQDGYTRFARLAWGDTARVYPLGPPRGAPRESLWVDVVVQREPAGGETRPAETVTVVPEAGMEIVVEAVVRPRRAVVIFNLVRGAAVTGPRRYDLVPEGESRRVEFVLGPGERRVLEVSLARPEPLPSGRDRTLALDADFVCLRVTEPATAQAGAAAQPAGVLCGRLNNVARRLPLAGGDTLVATFAWPGYR
ncbi:MAG TPA: hypothetical protein VF978_04765 [Gemmatimonadales bacterium]